MSPLSGRPAVAVAHAAGADHARRSISREQAREMQSVRILEAMGQVVAERGFRGATVAGITTRARVSRSTFYEVFVDLDDCFVALLRRITHRFTALVSNAFEQERSWPDGVLAGLVALLDFLDSEPLAAQVCLIEMFAAGPAALALRANELIALAPLVDAGRAGAPRDWQIPAITAEAVVTSIAGLLHNRFVTGEAPPFIPLLAPLAGVVTMPYLDARSVTQLVDRAALLAQERAPAVPRQDCQVPAALLAPTAHRLRSALLHICSHPGASNQDVAAAIAMRHHGQMSKLLARLESLGLLSKRAGRAGHPNAWSLTSLGGSVAATLMRSDST